MIFTHIGTVEVVYHCTSLVPENVTRYYMQPPHRITLFGSYGNATEEYVIWAAVSLIYKDAVKKREARGGL